DPRGVHAGLIGPVAAGQGGAVAVPGIVDQEVRSGRPGEDHEVHVAVQTHLHYHQVARAQLLPDYRWRRPVAAVLVVPTELGNDAGDVDPFEPHAAGCRAHGRPPEDGVLFDVAAVLGQPLVQQMG